jgi:guanosine-3',5'-bis(diphosphate) 3'-pyrophosphohydrolase
MDKQQSFDDFAKSRFTRLLKSFTEISDIVKITRAFGLATKAHMGQFSRALQPEEPYIDHLLRVALILAEELQIHDTDTICASLLHDSLKSGIVTEQDLRDQLGDHVCETVRLVTEPDAKRLEEKEKEKIQTEYYHNVLNAPKDARYIKVADRLDYARSLKHAIHRDMVARYKEETQKYVMPIAEKTDEKLVFKLSVALYELK